MALQEAGVPIHVIPLRTPEREAEVREQGAKERVHPPTPQQRKTDRRTNYRITLDHADKPVSIEGALLRLAELGKKLKVHGPKDWAVRHDAYFDKEI